MYGRSPRGERGLKCDVVHDGLVAGRRSPRGERGLKSQHPGLLQGAGRRSPRGERGLKFREGRDGCHELFVAPHAGSVD